MQAVNEFGGLSQYGVPGTSVGIVDVKQPTTADAIYTLDGKRVATAQRGINLVRQADGTVVKTVVK